jgi:hypothetical protein
MLLLGEHEEALALAALLPPSQAQQRRELEDAVHLSFGRQLFREGAYEEALAHLGMSGLAGPLQLLRLFPSLAPPNLLAAAAAEQAEGTERGGGEASAQPPASEDEEESVAEPQGAAFQAAVQVLLPYLLSQRSRLAAAASPAKGGGGPPDGGAAADERAASGALPPLEPELDPSPSERAALVQRRLEGSAAAALLDTALLLALLALPDSGALLRWAPLAAHAVQPARVWPAAFAPPSFAKCQNAAARRRPPPPPAGLRKGPTVWIWRRARQRCGGRGGTPSWWRCTRYRLMQPVPQKCVPWLSGARQSDV